MDIRNPTSTRYLHDLEIKFFGVGRFLGTQRSVMLAAASVKSMVISIHSKYDFLRESWRQKKTEI